MKTDGSHAIRPGLSTRLRDRKTFVRKVPHDLRFPSICERSRHSSVVFADADIALGMEEIAINLNTQLGRQLKEREWRYCDFMILIRSVP